MTLVAPPQTRFPLHPPRAWFSKPDWLEPGQKLTVVTEGPDAGRVAGYVAPWKECILDGQPGCWTVPQSPTSYRAAMQGETLTAEGDVIPTANLGGGVNHARLSESFRGAVNHMENTASQLMRVVYGEDDYGVWSAGAVWPDVTDHDLAVIRASALSGDWRFRPEIGAFDMAGAILVNNPGFPLIKRGGSRVASLTLPAIPQYGTQQPTEFPYEEPAVYIGGLGGAGAIDGEPCCDVCARRAVLVSRVEDLVLVLGIEQVGGVLEEHVAGLEAKAVLLPHP